jgi:hypothetical protein
LPEEEELPELDVAPPELGTVFRSLPLVLLPGVLDIEPLFDDFESGAVFRSLPLVLLPGVCILPPDDEEDAIAPEDELCARAVVAVARAIPTVAVVTRRIFVEIMQYPFF